MQDGGRTQTDLLDDADTAGEGAAGGSACLELRGRALPAIPGEYSVGERLILLALAGCLEGTKGARRSARRECLHRREMAALGTVPSVMNFWKSGAVGAMAASALPGPKHRCNGYTSCEATRGVGRSRRSRSDAGLFEGRQDTERGASMFSGMCTKAEPDRQSASRWRLAGCAPRTNLVARRHSPCSGPGETPAGQPIR